MPDTLEDLAKQVADDQAAIDGQCKDTRKRVIHMGKLLGRMQKTQKKEQAETGQTWKEYVEEQKRSRGSFPAEAHVRRYILIARYPAAYKSGMSIKEAYKEAGRWKKNGGAEPPKEKVTIKARPCITIGAAAGKLERKMETLMDKADLTVLAREEGWTEDEILGATDSVTLLKQTCNLFLKQLKEVHNALPYHA